MTPNLYLAGFSYTGKSTVGNLVAGRLGLLFLDTDGEIERRAGMPVPQVFATEGEARFRELERQVLQEAANRGGLAVATGGGIVQDPANREAMARSGAIVCLEARPETVLRRLQEGPQGPSGAVRPLLQAPDPLERIRALKAQRQRFYALADWTVHTDALVPEEVASEVARGAEIGWRRWRSGLGLESPHEGFAEDPDVACVVRTQTACYPIVVGTGVLPGLGARLRALGFSGQAHIITDKVVAVLQGPVVLRALREAGFTARIVAIPPGERSKTLDQAGELYAWLAEGRAERRDIVVALGGGVIGDLAGFVAATYARGLALAQVPTTLLAMADASIGGKVAVDLPVGKNLVGAFHQPSLVLADVRTLATLPPRIRTEGWAEVLKTALILDTDLVRYLEEQAEALLRGDEGPVRQALARCAALKGWVVSLDEQETTGLRSLLNYGHTLGHALEMATGYTGLLHGEAVAIGMAFAGQLARRAGLLQLEALERQERLLGRFRLPARVPQDVRQDALHAALALDKKVEGGRVRWVLLDAIGHARLQSDLPAETVEEALEAFLARRS